MSLFADPEEHAANPPQSWRVVKVADRRWALRPATLNHDIDTFTTRHEAVAARTDGFLVTLWEQEQRWYAGGAIANWKPYAPRPHYSCTIYLPRDLEHIWAGDYDDTTLAQLVSPDFYTAQPAMQAHRDRVREDVAARGVQHRLELYRLPAEEGGGLVLAEGHHRIMAALDLGLGWLRGEIHMPVRTADGVRYPTLDAARLEEHNRDPRWRQPCDPAAEVTTSHLRSQASDTSMRRPRDQFASPLSLVPASAGGLEIGL